MKSSPRMWGCFQWGFWSTRPGSVFPTHVGVFQDRRRHAELLKSLPHACGGVSGREAAGHDVGGSSPRMWGCFQLLDLAQDAGIVFPTHVGVFPLSPSN